MNNEKYSRKEKYHLLKIAVVDDVENICLEVEKELIEIAKEQGIPIDVDVYYNGIQFCDHLNDGAFYDLVFLDIEMEGLSGLEVSKSIRCTMKNESTQIAYISGNKEYAIDVFDYDPLYFIHKPLTYDKIETVFLKLMHKLQLKAMSFSYTLEYENVKVPIKDIIYFESDNHQIIIYYYDKDIVKSDCFYGSLDNIQKQLEEFKFLRIHQTYYVNPIHIKKYTYEKIYMSTNAVLPISQSKRKEIRLAQLKIFDR